ncbi:MAG TPA: Glu/Leu/Phe/Val dehydrogenase dimerization domain-containing protein [Terriglobales bacterium]|nr:Glu/Leu/Phe/Val dehydrogenase dimerization domain-containing protein [Terriglobales bacterium]
MSLAAAVGFRENAYSSVRQYFELAADRLGLHPEMRRLLSVPFRELTVELPLRRDDDKLQLFRGFRVQHNSVRGPALGAMRLQPGLELDDLRASAESMTWRCALAGVPFGGAAGGIACDPAQLSCGELQRLVRRYTARLHQVLGAYEDLSAPGVDAGEEVMAWMQDELSALEKGTAAAVLGDSKDLEWGSVREQIVASSTAALVTRAAQDAHLSRFPLRIVVYSRDRSAMPAACALQKLGHAIVGVSEERGSLHSSSGIDIDKLQKHLLRTSLLSGFSGATEARDVLRLDCDVLVLGAAASALNGANAGRVRAKLVVEASELAITPAAERALSGRGIHVIPDLLGAAGYVLAASAEWSRHVLHFAIDEDRLLRENEAAMLRSYEQTLERSHREKISLRLAAYEIAIERVARSERLRAGVKAG